LDFKGLVVAFKDTDINIRLNGNGSILGGLVVAGNTVNVEVGAGNFETKYSVPVLEHVQKNLKARRFEILSWWE